MTCASPPHSLAILDFRHSCGYFAHPLIGGSSANFPATIQLGRETCNGSIEEVRQGKMNRSGLGITIPYQEVDTRKVARLHQSAFISIFWLRA